jgi:hypothetical protein
VRRALPELARLVRYETQAAARRDRATRALHDACAKSPSRPVVVSPSE